PVLTPQIKVEILEPLSRAVSDFAREYSMGGDSHVPKSAVLSALHIFSKLFREDEFTKFFLESDVFPVIGQLFELTFVKPQGSLYVDMKNVQECAQECWDQISKACDSHSQREAFIDHIVCQTKIALLDTNYSA
ncbi:9101_t:CDS:1, partial [Acaulospora colombiana]